MKSAPFASSLVLAGILLAGGAQAESPYAAWQSSDDDTVKIDDSFNRSWESTVDTDLSLSKQHSEDNDVDVRKSHSEDNDVAISKSHSEDNDVTKSFDYTSFYKTSEDNDVVTTTTEDNDVAVDLQFATPTLTSYKYQDQDAGHQADTSVVGLAKGHDTSVAGGTTVVNAGNDDTSYGGYGSPALVNNNTNQLPQNNLMIGGHNGGAIRQDNIFAGRDMGPKGVFAPVGNTTVGVSGSVGNQSGAQVGQSGDSANAIADPMSSVINP